MQGNTKCLPSKYTSHQGKFLQEIVGGAVEDTPQRVVRLAHHPLHAVASPDEMGEVDGLLASQPYEQILVVVRHAHHLVRNNLSSNQKRSLAFSAVGRCCWSCLESLKSSGSARGDDRNVANTCFR